MGGGPPWRQLERQERVDVIDWEEVRRLRAANVSWADIAAAYGAKEATVRGAYSRWLSNKREAKQAIDSGATAVKITAHGVNVTYGEENGERFVEGKLTHEQLQRITSLDQLLDFFRVDRTQWNVERYRVNAWEQHSVEKGVVPLYQVRAVLVPRVVERELNAAREMVAALIEDAAKHAPAYQPVKRATDLAGGDPVLFELAVFDPHIGMLAWGRETGVDYDTKIAVRDYTAAVDTLLGYSAFYNVERIAYVVGNDFLHVDGPAFDARGGSRGGATTAGTMQDVDSRLAHMFSTGRKALVSGIDKARLIAPVDVIVIPGNHDEQQMYRMGEVLMAWYRTDPEVKIHYGPQKRYYYQYGVNLLAFTHGLEFDRKRDSLALIMATEAPAEMWASTRHREWHVGHKHIAQELLYMAPVKTLSEGRAIRIRSLPGLTPIDAWHCSEGYQHLRTATALAFRKGGGIAGLHEHTIYPERKK